MHAFEDDDLELQPLPGVPAIEDPGLSGAGGSAAIAPVGGAGQVADMDERLPAH